MTLTIDSREKSILTDLVIEKAKSLNVETTKQWIEVGDYVNTTKHLLVIKKDI